MTPSAIEEAARRRYNSVGDSFWSSEEILELLYDACLELAQETLCIERTYSTNTVAGTQEYAFPTNTIAIKRVTYNGQKLKFIDMREDDAVTGLDMSTTSQGTPQYYFVWNETISLRPIPNEAATLKIWTFNEPSSLTTTSTLEIPSLFHMKLVSYILTEMAAKDSNAVAARFYAEKWEKAKLDVKRWMQKRKRRDSFAVVKDDEQLVEAYLGFV